MALMRYFHSQVQTWPCCFHPLGVAINPPFPAPLFLLTQDQSPMNVAGSYMLLN